MRIRSERGRRIAWATSQGAAVGAASVVLWVVASWLWDWEPNAVESWPWLTGRFVGFVALAVLLRRLAGGPPPPPPPPPTGPTMELVERLARSGRRTEAWAAARQVTGCSLEEARAIVRTLEKPTNPL